MTFAELALFMIGIVGALQALFYWHSGEPHTKESAIHMRQNAIAYIVIMVAALTVKHGLQMGARIFESISTAGGIFP